MSSKYNGPAQGTPYPLQIISPTISNIVIVEQQCSITQNLTTTLEVQLQLLAEQIQSLQSKAEQLIAEAKKNIDLHSIPCSVLKRAGIIYHLYERENGKLFMSIISPEEWGSLKNFKHCGSYELQHDMSWSIVDTN